MKLALPWQISKIDEYAEEALGIPTVTLMGRAGEAVARAVRRLACVGSRILVLAGGGNNGGDGYAAAHFLSSDYSVTVFDVFSRGQRTEEGKHYLNLALASGCTVRPLVIGEETAREILSADLLIDAVYGTGFYGELPKEASYLLEVLSRKGRPKLVAIDVPLGVNAADGSTLPMAAKADVTVALSFVKPGLVSYPAKEYVGKLLYDSLALPLASIEQGFRFSYTYIDEAYAKETLPSRPENSNKGSFGKLFMMTGSEAYRGAGHLSLAAALRGGVGYVTHLGAPALHRELVAVYPEAIYVPVSEASAHETAVALDQVSTAALVGSGCGKTDSLIKTVRALLKNGNTPLILDADAINVLAEDRESGIEALRASERPVIITPHPMEFSRISGVNVEEIQKHRIHYAQSFARACGVIVVLKGAATVVTDGEETLINSTGSSALAKAGSGDVLAGVLASLAAMGIPPLSAAALSVYYHGLAADRLAAELSTYGVTPSDLPREIAREIAKTEKNK